MTGGSEGQDIRDLIGMRSPFAFALVALYVLTCFTCAASTLSGVDHPGPVFAAAALCSTGAIVLTATAGDPLPLRYAIPVSAIGPLSCGLVFSVIPAPPSSALQTWTLGTSVALYTVMCVRGRTPLAWMGLVATVGVTLWWSVSTGQGVGYGIAFGVVNTAPLLMSSFFAYTLRPLSRSIFELRRRSTARVALEAAAAAVLDERDSQLERLDEMARPLLERTVHGPDLSAAEVLSCTLLEAELRDSLRARALVDPRLRHSVRTARGRGVNVVLLDDRAEDLAPDVRDALVTSTAEHIDRIDHGSATIRLLPAGRPLLATMLVDAGETYRIEYKHDGSIAEAAH